MVEIRINSAIFIVASTPRMEEMAARSAVGSLLAIHLTAGTPAWITRSNAPPRGSCVPLRPIGCLGRAQMKLALAVDHVKPAAPPRERAPILARDELAAAGRRHSRENLHQIFRQEQELGAEQ